MEEEEEVTEEVCLAHWRYEASSADRQIQEGATKEEEGTRVVEAPAATVAEATLVVVEATRVAEATKAAEATPAAVEVDTDPAKVCRSTILIHADIY